MHIDVMIRHLAHFPTKMKKRGHATIYRQTLDYFKQRTWWKPIGEVHFGLPDKEIRRAYENARAEYQEELRLKDIKALNKMDKEMWGEAITMDDLVEQARKVLPKIKYTEGRYKGRINVYDLSYELDISEGQAPKIKRVLEKESYLTSKKKEPKPKHKPKLSTDEELFELLKSE